MTNPQAPALSGLLDQVTVTDYLTQHLEGVELLHTDDYDFFFYGPDRKMPFATLGFKDNDYDRISQLDRPGIYRLNIGVNKETYRDLFGTPPALGPSGFIETDHDFSALDVLMPHPTYAPQYWLSVLNPSPATFTRLEPLIAEAYALAVGRDERRQARTQSREA